MRIFGSTASSYESNKIDPNRCFEREKFNLIKSVTEKVYHLHV